MTYANPFPGIRPFNAAEKHLFFGRDEQLQALHKKLNDFRFLSVVGVSGSGKSSLINAGFLPELSTEWMACSLKPQNDPVGNLALALERIEYRPLDSLAGPENENRKEVWKTFIKTNLQFSTKGIIETYRQSNTTRKLLIIVDQFEEIFRYRRISSECMDESIRFVNLLMQAVSDENTGIYVMISMRSDFLGDCSQFSGFPEMINKGQFLVPRLTRDQLRLAITEPLHRQGIHVSSSLLSTLLNDIEDDPDQLPVLQHALMRTFNAWATAGATSPMLTINDYEATGGMVMGIDRHCDAIFNELDGIVTTGAIAKLFQTITDINAEGIEVRRPQRLDEVMKVTGSSYEESCRIINAFRQEGAHFLLPGLNEIPTSEIRKDCVIDITHECMMRKWVRLKDWIGKEEDNKRVLLRLVSHFESYSIGERGFLANPTLSVYVGWEKFKEFERSGGEMRLDSPVNQWAKRYTTMFPKAVNFVARSRSWHHQRRRSKVLLGALALLITAGIGFYEIVKRDGEISKLEDMQKVKNYKALQQRFDSLKNENDSIVLLAKQQEQQIVFLIDSVSTVDSTRGKVVVNLLHWQHDSLAAWNKRLADAQADKKRMDDERQNSQSEIARLFKRNKKLSDSLLRESYFKNYLTSELIRSTDALKKFREKMNLYLRSENSDPATVNHLSAFIAEVEDRRTKVLSSFPDHHISVILPYKDSRKNIEELKVFLVSHGYDSTNISYDALPDNNNYFLGNNQIYLISKYDSLVWKLKPLLDTKYAAVSPKTQVSAARRYTASSNKSYIILDLKKPR